MTLLLMQAPGSLHNRRGHVPVRRVPLRIVNPGAAMAGALEGVVAFVSCRADGYMDPTPTIHNKLRAMGAQVATRLSKDVTHIVFRRKANPSAQVKRLPLPRIEKCVVE